MHFNRLSSKEFKRKLYSDRSCMLQINYCTTKITTYSGAKTAPTFIYIAKYARA
jgi:hypothetical protein